MLNITYLKKPIVEDEILNNFLSNHDIKREREYYSHERNTYMFHKWHDYDNLTDMDELIHVKFIDKNIGYGVFAS